MRCCDLVGILFVVAASFDAWMRRIAEFLVEKKQLTQNPFFSSDVYHPNATMFGSFLCLPVLSPCIFCVAAHLFIPHE
jgi:hypothetical protein